ncbi:MAG: MATE family efflux transporter [Oscillospiraceae bacterium]|jgi:putative MATE family efflux protein|nr:MATE family efflux transporter [Oscillospiraceae bacterium]
MRIHPIGEAGVVEETESRDPNDFSRGGIPQAILRMAFPLILAQVLNVLYNIVDRMYIGRIPGSGRDALTGLGVCFPIITLINAFAVLAGNGGAPLASIERGAGNLLGARRIMGNSFTLLIMFGVSCTALFFSIKEIVLTTFGASAVTLPYADEYLSIFLMGTPAVMVAVGMNPFINMQGFAKAGMMTVAAGALLNAALDPLFIFAFGMGVRGAALASVISQYVSAAWALRFLTGGRVTLKLRLAEMKPDFEIIKRILTLGFSNFVMSLTESAVQLTLNSTLALFGGDLYVGVMTVVNSVRQVVMLPASGFSQAASPVIGFNYGAKKYSRVKAAVRFMMIGCFSYSILAWALTMLAPAALIRVFNKDPALIEAGVTSARQYFALFFVISLQMVGQNGFLSLGKARHAIFFSFLRKGVIVIPMALLLPRLGLGVAGVFLAEPISDVVGSTACFVTFMLTQWRMLTREEKAADGSSSGGVTLPPSANSR